MSAYHDIKSYCLPYYVEINNTEYKYTAWQGFDSFYLFIAIEAKQ